MKTTVLVRIIAVIAITNLYASDSLKSTPQISGEISNYQAILNITLAHKNEIFLSRINTLFNYTFNYILNTGDINVNEEKIKRYFNLKDKLFKNFDGKNVIKITTDNTGVYFENIYDIPPSNEELYFLQKAPNYPSLMKLYKNREGKYLLYMPFNPNVINFIKITKNMQMNTFVAPDKYKNKIKNALISSVPPEISNITYGSFKNEISKNSSILYTWLKPNGNGTYNLYEYDNKKKKWKKIATIENDSSIRPISDYTIGTTINNNVSSDNFYTINPKEIENKIIIKNLSDISINKIKDGTLIIVKPENSNNNPIITTYIKIGNTLQILNKQNLSNLTKEVQEKITKNYLNKYASIYLTFTEDNFDKSSKSFISKGTFLSRFITKGITFKEDPITKTKFAFLSGGANSYIKGVKAAKVFGYIQKIQKNENGATFTIIVPFRNATSNIIDLFTGKPLYNQKVRQEPFGVSGRNIGLYYAGENMCYNCYGNSYQNVAFALLHKGLKIELPQSNILTKSPYWMIAVWEYKASNKTAENVNAFNKFMLFEVKDGKFIKIFSKEYSYLNAKDKLNVSNIKDKKTYNPSVDYLTFGGRMKITKEYDKTSNSFDIGSLEIIENSNNTGFRGWIGGITIVPSILNDNQIKNIIKYQMPNLIKE